MSYDIKSVKLRDKIFMDVEYKKTVGSVQNGRVENCNNPIHDDLKEKLQALAVHCVLIMELTDVKKIKDIDKVPSFLTENITVTGLSIGSTGDSVVLIFQRRLSTGKVSTMPTVSTKYFEDNNGYRFGADLQLAVSEVVAEVEAYLHEQKFGKGAQINMEMPEGSEGEGGESQPAGSHEDDDENPI